MTSSNYRWLLPKVAASLLGVTARTVCRWAEAGRISYIRTLGGKRRYREDQVLALRTQRLREATA